MNGGLSFTAATGVLLASGKAEPISKLHTGQKVLATDTRTGKDQPETVTAVLLHHDTDLYDLKVSEHGRAMVIDTTSNHLSWVPGGHGHGRWVKAAALKHGTHLRTPGGHDAVVTGGYVPRQHDGWMWDLTVPGNNDHDFYVEPAAVLSSSRARSAAVAVLVHNDSCPTTRFAVGADGTTEDLANDLLHPGGSPIGVAGSNPGIREIGGDLSDAQALADGRIDEERLRDLLAAARPRGWPLAFAVDASTYPRPAADPGNYEGTVNGGVYRYCASDQVRFFDAGTGDAVPLAEVPPLAFSEAMRDVDLVIGVTLIGTDPEWRDRGEGRRFTDYWDRYAFGDLGAGAKIRREVLAGLVPMLAIVGRCELEDRFLVVRGDLRTYRIHLGSGNIVMSPNDQYLCIVTARDVKITGQSIIRQVRRH